MSDLCHEKAKGALTTSNEFQMVRNIPYLLLERSYSTMEKSNKKLKMPDYANHDVRSQYEKDTICNCIKHIKERMASGEPMPSPVEMVAEYIYAYNVGLQIRNVMRSYEGKKWRAIEDASPAVVAELMIAFRHAKSPF